MSLLHLPNPTSSSTPSKRPRQDSDSKVVDPDLQRAVDSALEAQFDHLASKITQMLRLRPSHPSGGIVSSLRSKVGAPSSTASSSSSSSSSTQEHKDVEILDPANPEPDSPVDQLASSVSDQERYAPTVIANAKTMGSVVNWVNGVTFKRSRNHYECLAIASAIDAFLADGVPTSSDGMEILCRRLSGVHMADQSDNWDLCKAIEWPYASSTLLDQRLQARAIKDASAIGRLRDRVTKKSTPSFNRRNVRNFSKYDKKPGASRAPTSSSQQ
jgi:hypothetical protein